MSAETEGEYQARIVAMAQELDLPRGVVACAMSFGWSDSVTRAALARSKASGYPPGALLRLMPSWAPPARRNELSREITADMAARWERTR